MFGRTTFVSCTQERSEFIGPQGPISDAKLDLKITKAITRPDMHSSIGDPSLWGIEQNSPILTFKANALCTAT